MKPANVTADTIGINDFAKTAHTIERGSHYAGPWSDLIDLLVASDTWEPGFRPGVWMVIVPAADFRAGVVALAQCVDIDSDLRVTFGARCPGEDCVLDVRVDPRHKMPAATVRIVVYSAEVLADEATTGKPYEVVTILAETEGQPAPMPPITMARNFLGLVGGTKGDFTAEDFADAIMYWATHAVVG